MPADESGDFPDVTHTHTRTLRTVPKCPHPWGPFAVEDGAFPTHDMPLGHSFLNLIHVAPTYGGLPHD